jgi:quinol monooxygenase YgiN
MILINVKFPVRPEKVDEWTSLATAYAEAVEAEDGSLFFEWSRSLADPTVFVAVEGFRDADAGAAHVATPHFAELIAKGPDLVAEQPQIIYIDAPQVDGWGPMGEIQPRA